MIDTNEADESILSILEEGRNTPSNIARRAEYTREYVAQRLTRLVEHEVVVRVDRGLYGLAKYERRDDSSSRSLNSSEPAEGGRLEAGSPGVNPRGDAVETRLQNRESTAGAAVDVEDALEQVADETLPGTGAKLDERKEALRAVYEYLRDADGPVTPAEFRREVYPEHEARYTTGDEPSRSWWKNCLYPGLKHLAQLDDAVVVPDYSGEWTYQP